jgi:hypothetical protein
MTGSLDSADLCLSRSGMDLSSDGFGWEYKYPISASLDCGRNPDGDGSVLLRRSDSGVVAIRRWLDADRPAIRVVLPRHLRSHLASLA